MNRAHLGFKLGASMLVSFLCLSTVRVQGQTELANVYVNDHRPVKAAVSTLIRRYPVVITYEDPRYEYSGDILDVTAELRIRHPGAHTTLVPRGGSLQASYQVSSDTGRPVDVASMLDGILEVKNLNPVGGRFAVRQSGDVFHIVPTEVRDSTGHWVKQRSILDTPITISSGEVSGYELMVEILKELSNASGIEVGLSAERFTNAFRNYKGSIQAQDEPARDVLLRALHSISERFTWMLSYAPSPSDHYYVFAVDLVAAPAREIPVDLSKLPRPGEPTPAGPPFVLPKSPAE